MNANTENLDESLQPRTKPARINNELGSARKGESESQLRSRLLAMILESELNRKDRFPATPHATPPHHITKP